MSSWNECARLGDDPALLLREITSNIVAYQPARQRWFRFSLAGLDFNDGRMPNWADCLFCDSASALTEGGARPTFFLYLDCMQSKDERCAEGVLLDFLRYLRLSKHHPRALSAPQYELWRASAVCFSFQPRDFILRRRPEGLTLFAPSVRYCQLPLRLDTSRGVLTDAPPPADDDELIRFVNSTRPVNLSSNHDLADIVGPYAMLRAILSDSAEANGADAWAAGGLRNLLDAPEIENLTTEKLHEMLWQSEQDRRADGDAKPPLNSIGQLVAEIRAASADKCVFIVDDKDSRGWDALWGELSGGRKKWERARLDDIRRLLEKVDDDGDASFEFRDCQLVILDFRLNPQEDRDKPLEKISGYRTLRFIKEHDPAVPVLIFTGSQRGTFLQELRAAGADAVCNKPARLDTASALVEALLREVQILLSPEFKFLQDTYYELKDHAARLTRGGEVPQPLRWAQDAWSEARRNVRAWLTQPESLHSRLSAQSVARTAGFVGETIVIKKKAGNPYVFAVQALRNAASHAGAEDAFGVEAGYMAVGLVTKLISVINNKYTTLQDPGVIIETPNKKLLDTVVQLKRISDPLARGKIRGVMQFAMLTHLVAQHADDLGLSTELKGYLRSSEEKAVDAWTKLRGQYSLVQADYSGLYTGYQSLAAWLDSLGKP